MRSYLEIMASYIDRAFVYNISDVSTLPSLYAQSGVVDINYNPKLSWWYIGAMRNALSGFTFANDLSFVTNGINVKNYQFSSGTNSVYAMWLPSSSAGTLTYNMSFSGNGYVTTTIPASGYTNGIQNTTVFSGSGINTQVYVNNSNVTLDVTKVGSSNNALSFNLSEIPLFVSFTPTSGQVSIGSVQANISLASNGYIVVNGVHFSGSSMNIQIS